MNRRPVLHWLTPLYVSRTCCRDNRNSNQADIKGGPDRQGGLGQDRSTKGVWLVWPTPLLQETLGGAPHSPTCDPLTPGWRQRPTAGRFTVFQAPEKILRYGEDEVNHDNLAKSPKTRHPPTQHQEVIEGAGFG